MCPPLRPFGVQRWYRTLTPGGVTAFLHPGLTKLRPFGVLAQAICRFLPQTTLKALIEWFIRSASTRKAQATCRFLPQTTPKGQSMVNRGRRNAVTTPPASRTLSLHPEGAQRRTHLAPPIIRSTPFTPHLAMPITHPAKIIPVKEKIIPGKIQIISVIIYFFPGIFFRPTNEGFPFSLKFYFLQNLCVMSSRVPSALYL